MISAGEMEKFKLFVGEVQDGWPEGEGKISGSQAMIWVATIRLATTVVKVGKGTDYGSIGSSVFGQVDCVFMNAIPMGNAMDSRERDGKIPLRRVLDRGDERFFCHEIFGCPSQK